MALTNLPTLFRGRSREQGGQVTWARRRSNYELRSFVAKRHGRLDMVDLALE